MAYRTTNPASGKVLESFDNISDADLASRLDELDRGFRTDWPLRPIAERSRIIAKASQIIRDEMTRLAEIVSREWANSFRTLLANLHSRRRYWTTMQTRQSGS